MKRTRAALDSALHEWARTLRAVEAAEAADDCEAWAIAAEAHEAFYRR